MAIATQTINAMMLPLVFNYLIRLTNDKSLLGEHANRPFQKYFALTCTAVILVASVFTVVAAFGLI